MMTAGIGEEVVNKGCSIFNDLVEGRRAVRDGQGRMSKALVCMLIKQATRNGYALDDRTSKCITVDRRRKCTYVCRHVP